MQIQCKLHFLSHSGFEVFVSGIDPYIYICITSKIVPPQSQLDSLSTVKMILSMYNDRLPVTSWFPSASLKGGFCSYPTDISTQITTQIKIASCLLIVFQIQVTEWYEIRYGWNGAAHVMIYEHGTFRWKEYLQLFLLMNNDTEHLLFEALTFVWVDTYIAVFFAAQLYTDFPTINNICQGLFCGIFRISPLVSCAITHF